MDTRKGTVFYLYEKVNIIVCVVYGREALRWTYIAGQGTHAGHEQTHRLGATPGLPLLLEEQRTRGVNVSTRLRCL